MKKIVKSALLAAAAGGLLASAPALEARSRLSGEEQLAKMLEGREAGEPTSCIRNFPSARMTVIEGTAIVFKSGRTLYVNVPAQPRYLDDSDALVVRLSGSQLCKTDIINTIDRMGGYYSGNVFLGDFVPYRRTS